MSDEQRKFGGSANGPISKNNLRGKRKRGRFLFWLLISLIFLGIAFLASIAIAYKFYGASQKVIDGSEKKSFFDTMEDIAENSHPPLRGEERNRINILLVGLAGKNYPGTNLTDSIIIASVNPKTWQTALLSIPRDLFVPIPGTNLETKINALYARAEDKDTSGKSGINDLKETLENITGEPIDYYFALDFDGFKEIVDELGGVNVQVPKDIHDERYPGPNYSYETFDIEKGLQNLSGDTALKYARTRHDEDGDFGRAYRQQQILESARSKAFSLGTILNAPKISSVLDTLGEHLRTDVQVDEMGSFLELIGKIDTHTTINKVLDAGKAESVLAVSHVYLGGVRAFILIPRTGKYEEIRDIAKNIFDLELIARKQKEVQLEKASVFILNESGSASLGKKLAALLGNIGYDAAVASQKKGKPKFGLPQSSPDSRTVVYDLTKIKPFSLDDLSKKLSPEVSLELPSQYQEICEGADLCLVAGSDLLEEIDFEEDTLDDLEQGYDKGQIDEREYIELLKKGSSKKYYK